MLLSVYEAEVTAERRWCVRTVYVCDIPRGATASGQQGALSGVAADIACLVPCGWQTAEDVTHGLWLLQEALGVVGKVVQAALEEYCQRQLVGMGGNVRML